MEVFADDLGATLGELVVDAAVVLLVSVQLAEIHGLDQTRAASQEGFYAGVFHGRDDLAGKRTEVVIHPVAIVSFCWLLLLLLGFVFLFLCIFSRLFLYLRLFFVLFLLLMGFRLLWLSLRFHFLFLHCLYVLKDEN